MKPLFLYTLYWCGEVDTCPMSWPAKEQREHIDQVEMYKYVPERSVDGVRLSKDFANKGSG